MFAMMQFINLALLIGLFIAFVFLLAWLIRRSGAGGQTTKMRDASQSIHDDAGLRDLIAEGRLDDALSVYRAFTGVDQFTAEEAIKDLQREMRLGQIDADIIARWEDGDKAGAIETYQERTGASLSEALKMIDSLEKSQ